MSPTVLSHATSIDESVLASSDPFYVREWLASHHPKQLSLLDRFEIELRLGRLSLTAPTHGDDGAARIMSDDRRLFASRTVEVIKKIVGTTRWRNAAQLLTLLKGLGRELHAAGGFREPAIENIVRRIMCAVRDEAASNPQEAQENNVSSNNQSSTAATAKRTTPNARGLSSMLWAHPQQVKAPRRMMSNTRLRSDSFASETPGEDFPSEFYSNRPDLKQSVMEAIQEIMSDLEDMYKNINEQAASHIHAGEVILTYGRSRTIEMFLKAAAAKKRNVQVVICEGAPHFGGHKMAKSLSEAGIDTVVANDAATFALMARVNKVLLPAHAVLANGGMIAPSGTNMVALAAKQNSVPVVVVTGMFKLCPMYPHEGQDTLNDLLSPSSVVDYAEMSDPVFSQVELVNPLHDYVAPQLIDLYVTNIGGFEPSYIYRLLPDYYHSDDWESFE